MAALKRKGAQAAKPKEDVEQERVFGLREPISTEYTMFLNELPIDQRPFGKVYFQMECGHAGEEWVVTLTSLVEQNEKTHLLCDRCGLLRRWWGTRTATIKQEWNGYCPDGYDAFEWADLFVKDRGLWRFVHNEVLDEMTSDAMKEDDNATD